MTEFRTIRVAVDEDGIATLTFARPEVRNAINLEMVEEVGAALDALGGDPAVRVLVLQGEGKAFAGGADIGE